jgi:transposase-like protein
MRHFMQVPADWLPPHCPNPNCLHHKAFSSNSDFKRIGYYRSQANPNRIPRFLCKTCRRSFSRQTFSTTYWQKRPFLDRDIFMSLVGCMCNRQIARAQQVAHETIARHVARIARHCALRHQKMLDRAPPFTDVVADGFESFEFSQWFPIHHHVVVDNVSTFFITHTDSELRRKGRMTAAQKRRRRELEETLGRPPRGTIGRDMGEALETAVRGAPAAVVSTDEHPSYRSSVRRPGIPITHLRTNSRRARTVHNPLFPVNLLDLVIRHSSSNHKRETIAYSKRRQASAERLLVFQMWWNAMKWRALGRPPETPAMALGLLDRPLMVEDVLDERIFRDHVELSPRWSEYYARTVRTRALAVNREHRLKYAW